MAYDCGCCTQRGTHQRESTKKIQVKHNLRRRLYGGQGENKIGGDIYGTSCWHCNACMIICWKGIGFAGHCTQSGTPTLPVIESSHWSSSILYLIILSRLAVRPYFTWHWVVSLKFVHTSPDIESSHFFFTEVHPYVTWYYLI